MERSFTYLTLWHFIPTRIILPVGCFLHADRAARILIPNLCSGGQLSRNVEAYCLFTAVKGHKGTCPVAVIKADRSADNRSCSELLKPNLPPAFLDRILGRTPDPPAAPQLAAELKKKNSVKVTTLCPHMVRHPNLSFFLITL